MIRNFSIIAHIDHGKSTLADRLLEHTGTIDSRKMRDQVLDSMDLERERGITIKMQPALMKYKYQGQEYNLNLIDTPGHVDFYYEVSRALKAVEGSILLVDATQGVQAQTLSTLSMARELGKVIIPAISKVDSPLARIQETEDEIVTLLGCKKEDIIRTSGKTGEGVEELLKAVIERVPEPDHGVQHDNRALIFDFEYSNHQGIILYVRVFDGQFKKGDDLFFTAAKRNFISGEVGTFRPDKVAEDFLSEGSIGYIVTGIKEPGVAGVGDTVTFNKKRSLPLHGYQKPKPVVWASVYPESQDDFDVLRQSIQRLQLSDSSFSFEEENSGTLGRGFRCGFLGILHLEIITERLRREFSLELVVTLPSIIYKVTTKQGKEIIAYAPNQFPDHGLTASVEEPWVLAVIIVPNSYLGPLMPLLYNHESISVDTSSFGHDRTSIKIEMPLRELMRNFFDELKSVTSGYGSLSYDILDYRPADVVKLEILVAEEVVPAFTKIVSSRRAQEEAEEMVEKLYKVLPRQMFVTKIQGKVFGRIVSSRTLAALKKNVTAHLYGGDITRKKKLWEKQKKGKKKLQAHGTVNISQDVYLKMMKPDN